MKTKKPRKMSSHFDRPKLDDEECYVPCKGVSILLTQSGKSAELSSDVSFRKRILAAMANGQRDRRRDH